MPYRSDLSDCLIIRPIRRIRPIGRMKKPLLSRLAQIRQDLLQSPDQVVLVHLALPEAERQAEGPVRGLEPEDVGLAAAGLAPLVAAPETLAKVVAVEAAAGYLFQELDHLLLVAGLQHFQEQRLRGDPQRLDG